MQFSGLQFFTALMCNITICQCWLG